MRSRYTAYATGAWDHLGTTLAPEMLPEFNRAEVESSAKGAVALGLEVRALKEGGENDQTGSVEYVAKFKVGGQDYLHHEISQFRRDDGKWLYVDGVVNPKQPPRQVGPKTGRNDPCPCGSGKKFKKCCGA
jgi:SEC-C motif-containing protein